MRVLIIEHDPHVARLLLSLGEEEGYTCAAVLPAEVASHVEALDPAAIVVDTDPSNPGQLAAFRALVETRPELGSRAILLLGGALPDETHRWIRRHEITSVFKPFSLDQLTAELRRRAC